jgi:hypothetical protein
LNDGRTQGALVLRLSVVDKFNKNKYLQPSFGRAS